MLAPPAMAQQSATCPIVTDSVVSGALGGPVQTSVTSDLPPGINLCDFVDSSGIDYEVGRQINAFDQVEPRGPAMLVLKYNSDWPDGTESQLLSLDQPGATLSLNGYDMASIPGIGDAAVWIKEPTDSGSYHDSLLVERGDDIFALGAPDAPNAQNMLSALAQAVLANS
jgi:hypothetical protein